MRLKSGRIIKQNEIFSVDEVEIPGAFADLVQKLSAEEETPSPIADEPDGKVTKGKAEMTRRKGKKSEEDFRLQELEDKPGWFNIVDVLDRPVNEDPLELEEATELLETLKL